ncbi:MAG: hypothetical protein U0W24_24990 [Bacteroidales bacterium]
MLIPNQKDFYPDKKIIEKRLLKILLYFVLTLGGYLFVLYSFKSVLFTQIALALAPLGAIYLTLQEWLKYKSTDPSFSVCPDKLVLKRLNFLLQFNFTEIPFEEIKSIGTDKRMNGNNVESENMCIKLLNGRTILFNVSEFGITHEEVYKAIKEFKPDSKILNIGNFEYD